MDDSWMDTSSDLERDSYFNNIRQSFWTTDVPGNIDDEDRYFRFLCYKLTNKDPAITQIMHPYSHERRLMLSNEHSDPLGEALLGNNHVTILRLNIAGLSRKHKGGHQVLLNAIRKCSSLQHVDLYGMEHHYARVIDNQFLDSLARNKALQEVWLHWFLLNANSLSLLLLGSGRSMRAFKLNNCRLLGTGPAVTAAVMDLQEHKHLLKLCVDSTCGMLSAVQEGIASHSILQELIISYCPSQIASYCAILESPRSALQHLMLTGFCFDNEHPLSLIAKSILANQTMKKLTFGHGTITDSSFVQQLVSIYQSSTSKVHFLGSEGSRDLQNLLPSIFDHPFLGLNELEVDNIKTGENIIRLPSLLTGETPLECCKLSWLGVDECQTLIQVLPQVHKVKVLTLGFAGTILNVKAGLLHAFKKNSSLVKVVIQYYTDVHEDNHVGNDYIRFNVQELTKIGFYTKRNELLPKMLLEAPLSEASLSLYPKLFFIAKSSQRGPWLIWQSFLGLEDAIGPKGDKRRSWKRRRTAT